MKNYDMVNKGKAFEEEVNISNKVYRNKGIALIQKISTPWTVIRKGNQIVSAFPEGKSTLDFRGTVNPRIPVSFDCKETTEIKGLPLANIAEHQISYMRDALKPLDSRYYIPGMTVLDYWDRWQRNKGRRGFNFIPIEEMIKIKSNNGIMLDYLDPLQYK